MNYSLEETPLAKIDLTKDKMSAWIEAQGKGKKVEMDVYGSPSEKSLQELENVRKLSKELQDNIQVHYKVIYYKQASIKSKINLNSY